MKILNVQFVSDSWPDINKKIQKIEGWMQSPLRTFLEEATKMYVRRNEEKEKQRDRIRCCYRQRSRKPIRRKRRVSWQSPPHPDLESALAEPASSRPHIRECADIVRLIQTRAHEYGSNGGEEKQNSHWG
ncbi:uncharacterized protein ACOB8E_019529 isoform 1-T1 [Sarcophilus harrisii]